MKKNSLILIIILCFAYSCKAQSQLEVLNNYTNNIIGTWTSEDDSNHKIEFTSNSACNIYVNNVLESTFYYILGTTCGTNSNNGYDIFLKLKENNLNTEYTCEVINNISTDSNGIITLSITTERGKLETYIKE